MRPVITYDAAKRRSNLRKHGLDFDDAAKVFDDMVIEWPDERDDYGEERIGTLGLLYGRPVVVIWTQRDDVMRIISMRKATKGEQKIYWERYGKG